MSAYFMVALMKLSILGLTKFRYCVKMPSTSLPRSFTSLSILRASMRSESAWTKILRSSKSRIAGSCSTLVWKATVRTNAQSPHREHSQQSLEQHDIRTVQVCLLLHPLVFHKAVIRYFYCATKFEAACARLGVNIFTGQGSQHRRLTH